MTLAYNASGLRVKKYYSDGGSGGLQGAGGTMFMDQPDDLGMKAQDSDTAYNKGRDIDKIWVKNTANNYEFTIANQYLFDTQNKMKIFITLDVDTIENSGRLTLPEDTLTRVPKKAAWEYCLYIADNEYGYYTANGIKHSMPFGLAVNKVFGDSGKITIRLSKQVFNNIPAIRYTVSTFIPNATNTDSSWQGGSSAADVWPGSNETFAGEINGYGQITPSSITSSTIYTIFYLYDGIEPIVEYAPDGSILNRYIYAGNMHIARINGADTNYYHCDALGSIRRVSNESGTAVWGGTYYPFGEMSGNGGNVHGFTGKEFDSEMGLNYFCQRYYDPEIGRFMELDPFNGYAKIPQSLNRYAYCMNNPLKYVDPSGLGWEWVLVIYGKEEYWERRYFDDGSGGSSPPEPSGPCGWSGENSHNPYDPYYGLSGSGELSPLCPAKDNLPDRTWSAENAGCGNPSTTGSIGGPSSITYLYNPHNELGKILGYGYIIKRNAEIKEFNRLMNIESWKRGEKVLAYSGLAAFSLILAVPTGGTTVPAALGYLGVIFSTADVIVTISAPKGAYSTREIIGIMIRNLSGGPINPQIGFWCFVIGTGISTGGSDKNTFPEKYPMLE
jgi:RHS repeat-associated protein